MVVVAAAADSMVDGGDEEHKKRLREKAQLKMEKLRQQEVELRAAPATANVLVSGPGERVLDDYLAQFATY